ncbi:RsiV family protein [Alloalcanivorax sp. C16-1]|uniref:RsiV family protein n=1 Tax=Alloalcanivorax sp. C16-1 TaxID=3390051 RepID=UPI0039707658
MMRRSGQSPLLIVSALALALSLAACDNGTDAPAEPDKKDTAPATDNGQPDRPVETDGGDKQAARPVPAKLTHQMETLERRPQGCDGDDCPHFEVRLQVYEGQPELNAAVRRQLTSQLVVTSENPASPDSLEAAAEQFLSTAAGVSGEGSHGWELTGETRQLGRWKDLVTIAISSYEFTGGAHGLPVTRWLNWDLGENHAVPLGRLIESGQESAFWNAAERAHARWVEKQAPDDAGFREDWPFQQSESYRLTPAGVVLHYDVYSIAPYAMGQPELTVPWKDLEGVIRPRYRPH